MSIKISDQAIAAMLTEAAAAHSPPEGLKDSIRAAVIAAGPPSHEGPKDFQKRRFRMTRLAKIAASILVVAAITAGIVWLSHRNGSATIAWANVQERVRNIRTLTCMLTVHPKGGPEMAGKMMMEPGLVRQEIAIGPLKMTHIMNMREGRMLILTENYKQAVRVNLPGLPEQFKRKYEDSDILAKFKEMIEESEKELGERMIAGRLAKGYRLVKDNQSVSFWVDARTAEPLEMEVEMYGPAGQVTLSDFEFDKELDKALFSLELPAGYTERTSEIASAEDLAELLRFWAEARGGTFPDTLSTADWTKDCRPREKKLKDTIGEEEFVKRVTVWVRARIFLQIRPETQYHYAGKGVKLGDASKAIFWYKPQDSETYKVIYGDLSVRELAEADLPR